MISKLRNLTFAQVVFGLVLLGFIFEIGSVLYEFSRMSWSALTFPYPLDYDEGPVLDQTLRLASLENIYRDDFSVPPYTVTNSTPLYQLLQAPLLKLIGTALWYGRMVSLLSVVAAALLIALIIHHLSGDWLASALAGLTLLAFPFVMQYSILARGDMLGLALSLGGLYAIVLWPDKTKGVWISGLLFIAAAYTNQGYLFAAPLAACLWLILTHKWKQALKLAGIVMAGSLALFVGLNLLTSGGFYLNVITANLNPFAEGKFMKFITEIYLYMGFLVIGCLLYLIAERLGEWTRLWPLVVGCIVGAALTLLTLGKAGSSASYLLVAALALCIATGAMVAWVGKNPWMRALVLLLLAFQVSLMLNWARDEHIPAVMGKITAQNQREIAEMAEIIRSEENPVLADEYMGLIPLQGERLYFQPLEFNQLQQTGRWSPEDFIQSINAKDFSAVLLYLPRGFNPMILRWAPQVRNAIYENYQRTDRLAETLIYTPKSGP